MARLHADFRTGVRDAVPLQVGLIPYGLIVGIAAVRVGLTPVEALSLSAFIYAGASQLAAIDLLAGNAPLAVIVFTGAVVNARFLLFSASLAPYFTEYRLRWRAVLASLIVGMSYARTIAEFESDDSLHFGWYFLGVTFSLYVVWVLTTGAGIAVGASVPEGLNLTFIVPLVFLTLTVSAIKDRSTLSAALVGGLTATALAWLPMRLNLVTAGIVGIAAGLLVQTRTGERTEGDGEANSDDGNGGRTTETDEGERTEEESR